MPPNAAVTPTGVRDGDPAAISGLVDRRGGAVLAYCAAVCPPELVERAAQNGYAGLAVADRMDIFPLAPL